MNVQYEALGAQLRRLKPAATEGARIVRKDLRNMVAADDGGVSSDSVFAKRTPQLRSVL